MMRGAGCEKGEPGEGPLPTQNFGKSPSPDRLPAVDLSRRRGEVKKILFRGLLRDVGVDETAGLPPPQRSVVPIGTQQFVVRALFDDAAAV